MAQRRTDGGLLASRRSWLAGTAALGLVMVSGCGRGDEKAAPEAEPSAPQGPPEGSLEWAVAGAWRSASDRARDADRQPPATAHSSEPSGGP